GGRHQRGRSQCARRIGAGSCLESGPNGRGIPLVDRLEQARAWIGGRCPKQKGNRNQQVSHANPPLYPPVHLREQREYRPELRGPCSRRGFQRLCEDGARVGGVDDSVAGAAGGGGAGGEPLFVSGAGAVDGALQVFGQRTAFVLFELGGV